MKKISLILQSRKTDQQDEAHNQPNKSKVYRWKILCLHILISIFFLMLVLKLVELQILDTRTYKQQALNNKYHYVPIPSFRGEIFVDEGATKIVENRSSFSLHIVPNQLPKGKENSRAMIDKIVRDFDISTNLIKNIFQKGRVNYYRAHLVKKDVPYREIIYLAENLHHYKGLVYINTTERRYLGAEKYAHITGYLRKISAYEYHKKKHMGYNLDSLIGKLGVEAYYDFELRGRDGYRVQIVDAKTKVEKEYIPIEGEPIPGNNVHLTIDSRVQNILHQVISGYHASAVVTRVATGEVLGLYSYPSYDPNIFTGAFDKDVFKKYVEDENKPFLNKTIQGEYAPSSVFKIVVAEAALAHNKIDFYNDYFVCNQVLNLGPQSFKCEGWHGNQNMYNAIVNSCNIYFYKLGIQLGSEFILQYANNYIKLGQSTGIDLPYERYGRLPTHRWKLETRGTYWWDGDTANLSIGQGFLLTTIIQINTITAAIANGGIAYKPHVLKRYVSPISGEHAFEYQKISQIKLALSDTKIHDLQKALRQVVVRGTAKRSGAMSRLSFAGKTGTAQNVQAAPHAWFTAYAPYRSSNPNDVIAVTVFVEHGGHGGEIAAPFATAILEAIFYKNNPHTTFRRIMQAWTSKKDFYNTWLLKKGLSPLSQTYYESDSYKNLIQQKQSTN